MMQLLSYMHSSSWTGHLCKLEKEPAYIHNRLHRLSIDAIVILSLIYAVSVKTVSVRAMAVHISIVDPVSNKLQLIQENPKELIINVPPP